MALSGHPSIKVWDGTQWRPCIFYFDNQGQYEMKAIRYCWDGTTWY